MSNKVETQVGRGSQARGYQKIPEDFQQVWFADFYKEQNSNNFYRLQATFINGKPYVGFSKLYSNSNGEAVFTKKNMFMPAEGIALLKSQLVAVEEILSRTLTNLGMQEIS